MTKLSLLGAMLVFLVAPVILYFRLPVTLHSKMTDAGDWSWTLWATLFVGTGQLQWKIHEVTKFDGLSARQMRRLAATARVLIFRLGAFEALFVIGLLASVAGRLADGQLKFGLACMTTSWSVISVVSLAVVSRRIATDFRETEMQARTIARRRLVLAEQLELLRKASGHKKRPDLEDSPD